MLREYNFGDEAIAYVRSQMSQGHTLSKFLLQLLPMRGSVRTYLPESCPASTVRNFNTGGVTTTDETRSKWVHFISDYLGKLPGRRYAVFESLARPGDPYLSVTDSRFFSYGDEVYCFLTSEDRDPGRIVHTMRDANPYPFVGVLTRMARNRPQVQAKHEVAENVLQALAFSAEHILIGAYDNEAVLIWDSANRWELHDFS